MIEATTDEDGTLTLRIDGKFGFASFREFHAAIGAATPTRYVVDLTKVDFIDSSALGMLLVLRERVREDKARVVIHAGVGQPAQALKLSSFERLFTVS